MFLIENLGTITVGLALAGILAGIVVKLVRDKRQGKCAGCTCGYSGCAGRSNCR